MESSIPDIPRDIIFLIIRDAESSYGGSWYRLHKKRFQGVMDYFTSIHEQQQAAAEAAWEAGAAWESFDVGLNNWVFDLVEHQFFDTAPIHELFEDCPPRSDAHGRARCFSPGGWGDGDYYGRSRLMPLMGFVFRVDGVTPVEGGYERFGEWEPPDEHLSHEWGYRDDRCSGLRL
jgi:hypothetical protein